MGLQLFSDQTGWPEFPLPNGCRNRSTRKIEIHENIDHEKMFIPDVSIAAGLQPAGIRHNNLEQWLRGELVHGRQLEHQQRARLDVRGLRLQRP